MGNVFIEARPKGRLEGSGIEDYESKQTRITLSRPSGPSTMQSNGPRRMATGLMLPASGS